MFFFFLELKFIKGDQDVVGVGGGIFVLRG